MRRLSALVGKLVLVLVGMALLSAASLFIVGAFLATWPILRLGPRNARLKAGLDLALALAALAATLRPESEPAGPLAKTDA